MTSGSRAKAQRARAERLNGRTLSPRPDDEPAFQLGWAQSDGDVEEVKAAAVQSVMRLVGTQRTGEVEVVEMTGATAREFMGALIERAHAAGESMADQLNTYRRIVGLLREYGGTIITASTTGRRRPRKDTDAKD